MRRNIPFSIIIFFLGAVLYSNEPSFNIISPNGGEKLKAGIAHTIEWKCQNSEGRHREVVLTLYRNGIKYLTITHSSPNTGKYLWNIPSDLPGGSAYRIRIRSKQDLSVNDFSDADFSVSAD